MRNIECHPAGSFTTLATVGLFTFAAIVLGGVQPGHFPFVNLNNPVGAVAAYSVWQAVLFLVGTFIAAVPADDTLYKFLVKHFDRISDIHRYILPLAFAEEVYRWLLLGVLPANLNHTPFVTTSLAGFCVLSWQVLLYLTLNRKQPVIAMLPHFAVSIMCCFLFVKLGFWPTMMVHLISAAIVISAHRLEDLHDRDIWVVFYSLLPVIGGCLFMYSEPSYIYDLPSLFKGEPAKMSWWDWMAVTTIVWFGTKVLSTTLLYDTGSVEVNGGETTKPNALELAGGLMLTCGVGAAGLLFLKQFTPNVLATTLILSMTFCAVVPSLSGSATAKNFLTTLPRMFVLLSAFYDGGWLVLGSCVSWVMLLYAPVYAIEQGVE